MSIARHAVDTHRLTAMLLRDSEEIDFFLASARQRTGNFKLFHSVASNVYLSGAVVAPDDPRAGRSLRLSAQALTAIFAFQLDPPPVDFVLGEGPPVHYAAPDPSDPDILAWDKAFHLALIARQKTPLGYLCRVNKETFRGSSLVGYTDEAYLFMKLKQAVWQDPEFGWEGLLAECEAIEARAATISKPAMVKLARCLRHPYHRVLRSLGERDEDGFATALTDGLKLHKNYWSATEKLRAEPVGFVSLPLTALAALAWDRGLSFRVESDYLPWSWVTGELFRSAPAATMYA